MKTYYKTIWVILFAIAMGFLETSVVIYLRELYYPVGFTFPLVAMSQSLAVTELFREAATIIMILAVSVLVTEIRLHRFAWFLIIFSVWDITYYVGLKIILNWPPSLLTTDILFLLPGIWTGPVIAPVLNSVTMILLAMAILGSFKGWKPVNHLSTLVWILLIAGSVLVLTAYMKDFATFYWDFRQLVNAIGSGYDQRMFKLSTLFIPRSFDWLLYGIGVSMHLTAIYLILARKQKTQKQF